MPDLVDLLTDAEVADLEYYRCQRDPLYWLLNYGYIRDERGDASGGREFGPGFVLWDGVRGYPGQLDLFLAYINGEDINVLKARQLGASWLMENADAYDLLFKDNIRLGIIAQTEPYVFEHVARVRWVISKQPAWIQRKIPAVGHQSKSQIGLMNPDTGALSLLEAHVATASAARSITAKRIRLEEFAFYEAADEVMDAAGGTSSDAGGQLVVVSTSKGPGTSHHKLWVLGEQDKSGLRNIFMPWDTHLLRDDGWYAQTLKKYRGDAKRMQREFPGTPREAFQSYTGAIFPQFDYDVHTGIFDLRPDVPITLGWDCGFNHPHVWIAQVVDGDGFRLYDEICPEGVTAHELGLLVIEWFEQHGLDINNSEHYDVTFRDPAGAGDGETWTQLGLYNTATRTDGGKLNAVADGHQSVRDALNRPGGILIHREHCQAGIEQILAYRYKDDEAERVRKVDDHAADSLRMIVFGVIGEQGREDVFDISF